MAQEACPTFPQTVPLIENGTNVDADITNVPLERLRRRTDHLKCVLDNLVFEESANRLFDKAVTDAVADFSVVYFDDTPQEFELALAGTELSGNIFVATESTFALGVAINNNGLLSPSRRSDIVVQGTVGVTSFTDILQTSETLTAADLGKPCYLSALEDGKVTLIKPGVSVIVGYFISFTEFYVDVDIRNLAENHTHVRIVLDRFSFTPVIIPNPINIDFPDGVFRYPAVLLDPFPPLPPEGTALFVNGIKQIYAQDYFFDEDGLHLTELVPDPTSTPAPVPPDLDSENYELYFTIPASDTIAGVVTLTPGNGNIEIENCIPGGSANSGNLKISGITRFNCLSTNHPGPQVIKEAEYNATTDVVDLRKGPVVFEVAAGRNIGIVEDASIPGRFVISSAATDVIRQPVRDIALRNAKEQIDQELRSFIEFLGDDTPTGIIGNIHFPGPLAVATNLEIIAFFFGLNNSSATAREFGFSLSFVIDSINASWRNPFTPLNDFEFDLGASYTAFDGRQAIMFSIPIPLGTPESMIRFRLDRLPNSTFTAPYELSVGVPTLLYSLPLV